MQLQLIEALAQYMKSVSIKRYISCTFNDNFLDVL